MQFLPLVKQVGEYTKAAMDHYADLRHAGKEATVDDLALFVAMKAADWDPKIKGKSVLDDATRQAGARFIAGVAFNVSKV